MASVAGEFQASLAAATEAGVFHCENDDWDTEGAAGLDDMKRICAKYRLRDFRDSSHTENWNVSGNVTKAFELAADLVKRDFLLDGGYAIKLVSMKHHLTNA